MRAQVLTSTTATPSDHAIPEEQDRLIGDEECERLSGLSRTTRWRQERLGKFPLRRQLSTNRVGWLLSEVLAWRRSLAAPVAKAAA